MSISLAIENLRICYGASVAVPGLSFFVESGSMTSLVGSNGAGKTSILRAISGLLPIGGNIILGGHLLHKALPEARAALGLAHVPEGRHVFPGMTVLENLQLGAYSRKDREEARLIDEVEALFPRLAERRHQLAGSLSGGEQQMLVIGRALMCSPKIILLDEPTMGLSPQMIEVIIETLDRLRKHGFTLLVVEQNAVEAIRMSDMVYALRLGEVVDRGPGAAFHVDRLTSIYLDEQANLHALSGDARHV
ncbi:ABC transporter ATP-binding protein [Ensifer adhaerens]|uniref:ABC transporter ATP-binding protein n=1 Tax=Ensifer adhaerens TaxID=106592 RepID=UPI000FD803BA|nr:ABC transporter ATP-binding protein [Ensifer adhaerens]MDF8357553.1 ABC transporter ATP-binding protein [Ensifer adhaerens]THA61021.1 ABC transporter ATP-binding protein [Ensifer adhaerens]